MIETHHLYFNNERVGSRVDLYGTVYDISIDTIHLLTNDISEQVIKRRSNVPSIILVETRGGSLKPENAPDAPELTYGEYCRLRGHKHMAKTDTDLKLFYNHCNETYFQNRLPKLVGMEWSTRAKATAGYCRRTKDGYIIRVSVPYHTTNSDPKELENTIVHEMIHVLHFDDGHGPKFKHEMNRLNRDFGMNITVYAHGEVDYKYIYECLECGHQYKYLRRIKQLHTRRCRCHGSLVEYEL